MYKKHVYSKQEGLQFPSKNANRTCIFNVILQAVPQIRCRNREGTGFLLEACMYNYYSILNSPDPHAPY